MSMNQTSLSRQAGRHKRQPRLAGMVVKGIVTSVALAAVAAVAACQQGGQQQAAGGGTPPALPAAVIQAQVSPVCHSQNMPGRA